MTRRRLYPAKPDGVVVRTLSLDALRSLGDAPARVELAAEEHGLYRWGALFPLPHAYNTRIWLYVPDYPSEEQPPAFIHAKTDEVVIWKIGISKA